jgi:hypothetical protein
LRRATSLTRHKSEWFIQPALDDLWYFTDKALALAENGDDKWGFINAVGKWVIKPKI